MAEVDERDASSASNGSPQASESDLEENFGDAYLEVELSMEKVKGPVPEVLEIVTDPNLELEPPTVPSPSHMERKRSYKQQKLMKSYEMAALQGLSQVYQTFDF